MLRVTWLHVQRLMSILTLTMEENLQGIRVVRAFAAKRFEMGKFDAAAGAKPWPIPIAASSCASALFR